MDNRHISVQSEGRQAFDLAFQLLFDNAPGGKVSHYIDHPEKGLIFLWHKEETSDCHKLPISLSWQGAAALAWNWLLEQPKEKYHDSYGDGDVIEEKAFKVYNEDWGHVGGHHYAVLAVLPVWAWYGK